MRGANTLAHTHTKIRVRGGWGGGTLKLPLSCEQARSLPFPSLTFMAILAWLHHVIPSQPETVVQLRIPAPPPARPQAFLIVPPRPIHPKDHQS
jgi:hypothetical protein